ncbi:PAS domain-containing protein [uncultured Algimonas sp.]|uniref:PAS domain-containing protein n=1 Tax=uncultured Algimonas sp. TaxID=1547920 RepID=UPI0026101373|nr:PAS domain-containing protein [uncultured Algimonas sp.]
MKQPDNDKVVQATHRELVSDFPLSIVISNPALPDNPIVYVNRAFEKTTGYAASYAVGRNCRFLQGEDKDQPELEELRKAIQAGEPVTVDLTNYRLDGTPFRNRLMVTPLRASEAQIDSDVWSEWDDPPESGDIYAFMGIQSVIASESRTVGQLEAVLQETQHRVKNHLSMIAGLIRLQGKRAKNGVSATDMFKQLSNRVEALSLLYDEFSQPPTNRDFDYDVVSAGAYVSRVVATIASLDGRTGIRVNTDCDPVYMPTERAARLGLLTSEIMSNVLQHAFEGREEGILEVRLKEQGEDNFRMTFSDDGVGMGDTDWPNEGNLGARLVRNLARSIDAKLHVISSDRGTVVTIDFVNSMGSAIDETGDRKRLSEKSVTSLGHIEG